MYFSLNYCDRNNHHIERLRINIAVKNMGFIETTDLRPTDRRLADSPTTYRLPTNPLLLT